MCKLFLRVKKYSTDIFNILLHWTVTTSPVNSKFYKYLQLNINNKARQKWIRLEKDFIGQKQIQDFTAAMTSLESLDAEKTVPWT